MTRLKKKYTVKAAFSTVLVIITRVVHFLLDIMLMVFKNLCGIENRQHWFIESIHRLEALEIHSRRLKSFNLHVQPLTLSCFAANDEQP